MGAARLNVGCAEVTALADGKRRTNTPTGNFTVAFGGRLATAAGVAEARLCRRLKNKMLRGQNKMADFREGASWWMVILRPQIAEGTFQQYTLNAPDLRDRLGHFRSVFPRGGVWRVCISKQPKSSF